MAQTRFLRISMFGTFVCACTAAPAENGDHSPGARESTQGSAHSVGALTPATDSRAGLSLDESLGPPSESPRIDADTRRSVIEELARQLSADYVFADTGAQLSAELLARLEAKAYDQFNRARDLAEVLTDDVRSIAHDKHLLVLFSPPRPAGPARSATLHDPPPQQKQNGGIRGMQILEENIGYLELEGVPTLEASRSSIAGAFAFLQQTDALIIDNRQNGGGDPRTVALYVSYLSEGPPFVVDTFHFRKDGRIEEFSTTDLGTKSYGKDRPVFVLTSGATFSGGEALTYSLQALRRATVIGEVTGGGAHPVQRAVLGHQFFARIPYARSVNPITGKNWEGSGVAPDVAVPAERALMEAERAAKERLENAPLPSESGPPRDVRFARRGSVSLGGAQNPIINGDFSNGLAPWGVTKWKGFEQLGQHPHHFENGALCVTLAPEDNVLIGWPPETSEYAAPLLEGTTYQLSFQASLSGDLAVRGSAHVGRRLPPYTRLASADIPLGPTLSPFSIDFEPVFDEPEGGLAFVITANGTGASEVCLDDVAVVQLTL